ncbi:MAG: DUF2796 domain-containing protein [Hyphomicrobium sp.]|jgi:hypothetical protein
MRTLKLGLAALALASGPAVAAEEHRQLGPHEHGHGTLNIAVENNQLSIDLDVPGMDILGFEHTPSTPEQKATAVAAEAKLKDALVLFKVPAAAGCSVHEAKVAIEAETEHEHGAEQKDAEKKPDTDKHEPGEHEKGEAHSDYNATYVLRCAKSSEITSIAFDYFAKFPGAKALTVNIVSNSTQSSYEVTREKPILELSGTM